jgi:hypothetical protein
MMDAYKVDEKIICKICKEKTLVLHGSTISPPKTEREETAAIMDRMRPAVKQRIRGRELWGIDNTPRYEP